MNNANEPANTNAKKTRRIESVTPDTALQLLASAIAYAQAAGLVVRTTNVSARPGNAAGLAILIEGARTSGQAEFDLIAAPAAPAAAKIEPITDTTPA